MRAIGETCGWPREQKDKRRLDANHRKGSVWFYSELVGEYDGEGKYVLHKPLIDEMSNKHGLQVASATIEKRYLELCK